MSVNLKPCPFCGSEAERKENKSYLKKYQASVGCKNQLCPAKITQATLRGNAEIAYQHAESAWNDRKVKAKTRDEWHEEEGDVLWWTFPIEEPPYCGTPLDLDWPGFHTHWTPIVIPNE